MFLEGQCILFFLILDNSSRNLFQHWHETCILKGSIPARPTLTLEPASCCAKFCPVLGWTRLSSHLHHLPSGKLTTLLSFCWRYRESKLPQWWVCRTLRIFLAGQALVLPFSRSITSLSAAVTVK